jgi:hypothetical protein
LAADRRGERGERKYRGKREERVMNKRKNE